MKVLQVVQPKVSTILDVPIPKPGPGEILMRVEAVTTCPQWDLHLRHNEPMFVGHRFHYPYTPGQPGHEATGEIVELGEDVVDLSVGDRVSAWTDPGHHHQGCYAQYVVMSAGHVIRVPEGIPPEELAPVELSMCVGTVFLMLRSMDAVRGRQVGIAGLGPAGLIACQMAKAEGASKVIGFDLNEGRRNYALSLGIADAAFDPTKKRDDLFPVRPAVPSIDTSVECVGAKTAAEFLMDRTRDVVALFGVQREPYVFDVRHYRWLRLCGYQGPDKKAAEYAVDLIQNGSLKLGILATHHLTFEEYDRGIELLERQEAIKICFWPWREGKTTS